MNKETPSRLLWLAFAQSHKAVSDTSSKTSSRLIKGELVMSTVNICMPNTITLQ